MAQVDSNNEKTVSVDYDKFNKRKDNLSFDEVKSNINAAKDEYTKYYKKNKLINIIIMVVFIIIVALTVIFLSKIEGLYYIFALIGLVIIYFIITFIYSKKTKKVINELANKVIEAYFNNLDSYIFDGSDFEDVKFLYTAKFDKEKILDLGLFKNTDKIGSRDLVVGKFLSSPFIAGEAMIHTSYFNENKKKIQNIPFLGKMMIVEGKTVVNKGKTIIYLKGKEGNEPTGVDGLTRQEGILDERYQVYSSADLSKAFTEEAKNIFKELTVNAVLLDVYFLIESHRVVVGLSYEDKVMQIPLFDKFNEDLILEYKKEFDLACRLIKELKK